MDPGSSGVRVARREARLVVAVTDLHGRPVADYGLADWLRRVAPASARGEVAIALVSDARMRQLNRRYRHKNRPTDVLSFPNVETGSPHSIPRTSRASRLAPRASHLAPRPSPLAPRPSRHAPRATPLPPRASRLAPRASHPAPRASRLAPRILGDIVVATGVARRQARSAGHSWAAELKILALHGLLHLLGYDHERPADRARMERIERRLRAKGGLTAGLIERAGRQP